MSAASDHVDFVTLGFHVSNALTNRMTRPHRHDEIEITVLGEGWIDYLFGGRRVRIQGGVLCVRWAAIPHQSIDFEPGGIHYSLKVPLAWFLNWRLPESLVNRLLGGAMLIETEPDPGCSDFAMMRRWHTAFVSNDPEAHRMILLEAEARLLRLPLFDLAASSSRRLCISASAFKSTIRRATSGVKASVMGSRIRSKSWIAFIPLFYHVGTETKRQRNEPPTNEKSRDVGRTWRRLGEARKVFGGLAACSTSNGIACGDPLPKSCPHGSLLAPIERLGDGADVLFQDRIASLDRSGQVQDRVLNVGGQVVEPHDSV